MISVAAADDDGPPVLGARVEAEADHVKEPRCVTR